MSDHPEHPAKGAPPDIAAKDVAALGTPGESLHHQLFDRHPDPMMIYDLENLTYLAVNDAAIRQYGYSRDQFLTMTIRDIRPDNDVPALLRTVTRLSGHSRSGVWQHRLADGSPIMVDIISEAIEWQGRKARLVLARNVTGQFEAQARLHASEERFRLASRAASDVIWDWDLLADTIWWSEGLTSVLLHEQGEVLLTGASWIEYIHADDRDRVLAGIEAYFASKDEFWQDEYRFIRGDGSVAHVADQGYVTRNGAGKPIRMVGALSDITERRDLEKRLVQSQRLEAVGQLTGGIAHDFNNLLTVIMGNADTVAAALPESGQQWRLVNMIRSAADRGAALTSRLLAFARRQALEPRAVDVADLVHDMEDLVRQTLSEAVDLDIRMAENLWSPMIDGPQLETAILNLCLNARDAIMERNHPMGGRLTIDVGNAILDDDYAAHNPDVTPGDYVMVAVTDNGMGMSSEVITRAFDPFFTTKQTGAGSGLGLSMVYGFIKQSRGHVKIYSEEGEGTSLKLYLPRAATGEQPAEPRTMPTSMPVGSERILVVEDDDLVRNHVSAQLEVLGYEVTNASDGPEALDMIRAEDGFDLLFTDVVMPGGMSGRQLAQQAAGLRPDLRILFTSGYTENAIVHHGRLDPGVYLLNKPYRLADLALKIRTVLDAAPGTGQV